MNEKPKYTPGPWRAGESWRPPIGNFEVKAEDKDANGNIFWGYSIFGRNEHGGEVLPTLAAVHNFPDNMKANAHLIAAAPDLYEAFAGDDPEMPECIRPINWLHSLIQYCNARGPSPDDADPGAFWDMMGEVEALYEKGMAAIAKAEGRT